MASTHEDRFWDIWSTKFEGNPLACHECLGRGWVVVPLGQYRSVQRCPRCLTTGVEDL